MAKLPLLAITDRDGVSRRSVWDDGPLRVLSVTWTLSFSRYLGDPLFGGRDECHDAPLPVHGHRVGGKRHPPSDRFAYRGGSRLHEILRASRGLCRDSRASSNPFVHRRLAPSPLAYHLSPEKEKRELGIPAAILVPHRVDHPSAARWIRGVVYR